ncbi:MAG: virginiamycin B lyase family protein, partial [bacterium]
MSRFSRILLAAALACAVVTVAVQGQAPAAGGGQGGGRGQAVTLPDGGGKDLVQAACTKCHGLNQITGSTGYTRDKWHELFATMIKLPDPQAATVSQYLATHFPPKPGREPVLVSGPVTVTFKEWMVPTLGQRSRDPVQSPDGMIWWAGQYGSIVGRLNPRTGDMKEYPLPPGTRPHSITADRAGMIWYMGNGNGTVGKLNPANGEITVYAMPDPAARDPHTPIFDRNGVLWFTVQGGNFVGRLDPKTGSVTLKQPAAARSAPYGIVIMSDGTPVFDLFGTNKIGTIDPKTMAITEYVLPEGARPRRIAVDSKDIVWYT